MVFTKAGGDKDREPENNNRTSAAFSNDSEPLATRYLGMSGLTQWLL